MAAKPFLAQSDERTELRDEVYYRTRVTLVDRRQIGALVVNLSPRGLMARMESEIDAGEWITIAMPVIGTIGAVVRWSLGGRIGCQLERPVDAARYQALLTATRD